MILALIYFKNSSPYPESIIFLDRKNILKNNKNKLKIKMNILRIKILTL
jgi:hypothetical protein